MKSEKTIKATIEYMNTNPAYKDTAYGNGYKAGLEFCLEPELPYKVGDFFRTTRNDVAICVAHKPYAWWYFAVLGQNSIISIRDKAGEIKAFKGELEPLKGMIALNELRAFASDLKGYDL